MLKRLILPQNKNTLKNNYNIVDPYTLHSYPFHCRTVLLWGNKHIQAIPQNIQMIDIALNDLK